MWNRIRRAYGLAGLAIFVAISLAALTACETPAPGVAAPTASGEIADTPFGATETTKNVDLSNAFKGEKLTFTVRSSPRGVVAPEITADNRSIVIRAIGPGSATITVTATNAGGSASQFFKVTVPQPPPQQPPPQQPPPQQPPPQQPPETSADLTIKLGESAKRTLSSGQTLQEPASGGVDVERSPDGETGNVWLITAKRKGIHKVTVLSAGKAVVR